MKIILEFPKASEGGEGGELIKMEIFRCILGCERERGWRMEGHPKSRCGAHWGL